MTIFYIIGYINLLHGLTSSLSNNLFVRRVSVCRSVSCCITPCRAFGRHSDGTRFIRLFVFRQPYATAYVLSGNKSAALLVVCLQRAHAIRLNARSYGKTNDFAADFPKTATTQTSAYTPSHRNELNTVQDIRVHLSTTVRRASEFPDRTYSICRNTSGINYGLNTRLFRFIFFVSGGGRWGAVEGGGSASGSRRRHAVQG